MSEVVERVATAMAEATNGGKWDDGHYYHEDHKHLWLKRAHAAIEAMREPYLSKAHIIKHMDETTLTGLVMTLTGGSANPAVVRGQIRRIRCEQSGQRGVPTDEEGQA